MSATSPEAQQKLRRLGCSSRDATPPPPPPLPACQRPGRGTEKPSDAAEMLIPSKIAIEDALREMRPRFGDLRLRALKAAVQQPIATKVPITTPTTCETAATRER